MLYQIKSRFDGRVKYEVEITCAHNASEATKLGNAVLAAVAKHADLGGADLGGADLRSAHLHGADLRSADLRSADLGGADLHGADLHGADLHGADLGGAVSKVTTLVASISRSDGYMFHGFVTETGALGIVAGCQNRILPSYRAHVVADYPKRYNGAELAEETTAILDFLEKRFAAVTRT